MFIISVATSSPIRNSRFFPLSNVFSVGLPFKKVVYLYDKNIMGVVDERSKKWPIRSAFLPKKPPENIYLQIKN